MEKKPSVYCAFNCGAAEILRGVSFVFDCFSRGVLRGVLRGVSLVSS